MGEEHQHEQEAVGRRRDHEEIGRDDLADVIPQECAPGLRGRPAPTCHVFRHRRLRDVDPEFQQFAVDPRRAPARVRLRHRPNQRAHVGGHGRSPDASPALPCPPQPEAARSVLQRDDCLRLDDHERCSPVVPEPKQPIPTAAVRQGEPQSRRPRSLKDLQLVPQGEHLELECRMGTRPSQEGQDKGDKHRHHRGEAYPPDGLNINVRKKNGLFSRHSLRGLP